MADEAPTVPAPTSGSERFPPAAGGLDLLVVDDDALSLRAMARELVGRGHRVTTAHHGAEAVQHLLLRRFDGIVSDIGMPDVDGIELLRLVRSHDAAMPVILVTGAPSLETAMRAVEHGAHCYLRKPLGPRQLGDAVDQATRRARALRHSVPLPEAGAASVPSGSLTLLLDSALASLWVAFQPIVDARTRATIGYEALLRSREPGLPSPPDVLGAAEKLGRLSDVGAAVRACVARHAQAAPGVPFLFVNLHPADLADDALYHADAPLHRMAHRVVLEVTERASLDHVPELKERVAELRALGYRIALDDLGAGYAGLGTFAQLEPDLVKLDRSLVQRVELSPVKQRLVRSITQLTRDLGIEVVGEGVETPDERDCLAGLGCDYLQGYLLGKPGPELRPGAWGEGG